MGWIMSEEQKTEQTVVEQQPVMEAPPQLSDEQNALLVYKNNLNTFLQKLHNYSGAKSQIVRAWSNSVISPLNSEELHFSYPEEKELFDLATTIDSAKFILMLYSFIRDGKIELKKPLFEEKELTPSEAQLQQMLKPEGDLVNKEENKGSENG
jgi:hypothetical protein